MTGAQQRPRWHEHASAALVADRLAEEITARAHESIAARRAFHVVLTGGTTPRALYERLASTSAEWSAWHVYFSDERCLPPDHPDRNSVMADETLLAHVAIPRSQIHVIPAEAGPVAAARTYAAIAGTAPRFDAILLGLGDDGHVASLFPGRDWGRDRKSPGALPVFDAPKSPPERVTLSAWRLSHTRSAYCMVTGASKRYALAQWRSGIAIPATAIAPACGIGVFLESAPADG